MSRTNDVDRGSLDRKFPSLREIEERAIARIPRFAREYLQGGIADEVALQRNRQDLDRLLFLPRHLTPYSGAVDTTTTIFGQTYAAPFGVAPVGLTGLIWPGALREMASAAMAHTIPLGVSSSATESLEDLTEADGQSVWFQLYGCREEAVEHDMMERALAKGCDVLLVTVDILGSTRRKRELQHGISVPPRLGMKTVIQAALHPAWSIQTLRYGIPSFRMLEKYMPKNASLADAATTLGALRDFRFTPERLEKLRKFWPGKMVVKGILHPEDARISREIGADGVLVSNHGGRQMDAVPTVGSTLPAIREAVGRDFPLIADSGARSGTDILRLIAQGADFVLLGRPFLHGVASGAGAEHVMHVLKEEISQALAQIGCITPIGARERIIHDVR